MRNYYTRSVCFKYSKFWFNRGICQSTDVSVCTTLEFLSCVNWNCSYRNFQTGIIVNTTRKPNGYDSRIFTRTKKDGNYRMILNLKTFNQLLKLKHCKLESIEDALDLIMEGWYFVSVDLEDADYNIPIHENYQKYLK